MKERVLAGFLAGRACARELRAELNGVYLEGANGVRTLQVECLDQKFVVTREGLLRLCAAVLAGDLDPAAPEPIADCLVMSEAFVFDDVERDVLAPVTHCWSAPEICHPLTAPNIAGFRAWLATGVNPLD